MKKILISLIIGILLGAILTGLLIMKNIPDQMLKVVQSKYDFEETVSRLQEASFENGWEVKYVYELGDCLFEEGFGSYMNVSVISICHSEYSYELLQEDENKRMSAIMPCRISIYEDSEGDVYVARMNIGLFSKVFPGTVGEILGLVAEDDDKITESVIKD